MMVWKEKPHVSQPQSWGGAEGVEELSWAKPARRVPVSSSRNRGGHSIEEIWNCSPGYKASQTVTPTSLSSGHGVIVETHYSYL